jgi:hypothetical protein
MIRWLYRLLRCQHEHAYRERRPVGRVAGVMHLCCPDCGHVAPVLERSTREHLKAIRDGRVKQLRVMRQPAKVEHIRGGGR